MSNINRNLQKSVVDPVKVHIFRILAQKGKNSLNESAFPTCPKKNAIMSTWNESLISIYYLPLVNKTQVFSAFFFVRKSLTTLSHESSGISFNACKKAKLKDDTVWHEIFAGVYFYGLATFCDFCN